jgi:hypothetical protein
MIGINGFDGNGRGPWRILQECPGTTHNSGRSAKGVMRNSIGQRPKCICPHALDLMVTVMAEQRRRERERMKRLHRDGKKDPRTRLQPPAAEPVKRRSPNFAAGLCTTPSGMLAADRGMNDQASLSGIKDRELAKSWCANCPMLRECRRWVTEEESPAGSWGGVWGGLDPWNRKDLELVIRDGRAAVIPYVHA